MVDPEKLELLADRLKSPLSDKALIQEALTHKSYANENRTLGLGDNERLEFLGDAVLDLIVSDLLFKKFPHKSEGELSKMRASLVMEKTLSRLAGELDLGDFVLLGKGEALSGGRSKPSILANTFEAIVAFLYLDSGMENVRFFVEKLFAPLLEKGTTDSDFKSQFQELCQSRKGGTPLYRVAGESGPDHDKRFEVVLEVNGEPVSKGEGRSIKDAEQMAAREALGSSDDEFQE